MKKLSTEIKMMNGKTKEICVELEDEIADWIINEPPEFMSNQVKNAISLAAFEKVLPEKYCQKISNDDIDLINSVTSKVTNKIIGFVKEIEEEYIGEKSSFYVGLKLDINEKNEIVSTEYTLYNGYTNDIKEVVPESAETMFDRGEEQFYEIIKETLLCSTSTSSENSNRWNESFVYYRTDARDYANAYTSTPLVHFCTYHGCDIRQDTNAYNPSYEYYCCNDCANFVSQAMYAGGVPTRANDWEPYSSAWIGCSGMKEFFIRKTWWSTTNITNCNAGGIILLIGPYETPYHVQMCVYNDTVTRKFSSHTNDFKECSYFPCTDFGATDVEFYRFDNVWPSH